MSKEARYQTWLESPPDNQPDVSDLLRRHGLRPTPQRRAVWQALVEAWPGHPSADELLEGARRHLPGLSRATVYNAVRDLAAAGLLVALDAPGAQRFDLGTMPHEHFRCSSCGGLHDLPPVQLDRVELPPGGFTLERVRVLVEGLCPSCRGTRQKPPPVGKAS